MDMCSYYPYGWYGVQLTRSNLSVGTPFHELWSDSKEWPVQITNNFHFDVFFCLSFLQVTLVKMVNEATANIPNWDAE
jgi:hypothetical protein